MGINLYFLLLVLKQVNAVVVATRSIIQLQNCLFLMLLKIWNNPIAKVFVPDVVKNFECQSVHLMSRTNETRHIKWHEMCKCKCRLDASVCNNKQHWNDDKCRCECKELIDKGVFDKGSIWNPSMKIESVGKN